MIGIDTNVLVRLLVGDDQEQMKAAAELCAAARESGEKIFVSVIALCETYWVLDSVYRRSAEEILDSLEALTGADVFTVEDAEAVLSAIRSSRQGNGDFADHLAGHRNLTHGCRHTLTFDRGLKNAPAFRVIRPG